MFVNKLGAAVLALTLTAPVVLADTLVTVCPSGCDETDLQSAIDGITDSGPDKVYTIRIEAGVLETDTSISTNGKSYLNFIGRGMDATILRASSAWYTNVANGTTGNDLLDLSGSTDVTVEAMTVDSLTNDSGNAGVEELFGVRVKDSDRIRFQGAKLMATSYALWDNTTNDLSKLIQVFDSVILSARTAVRVDGATWHFFSSELKVVQDGTRTGSADAVGIFVESPHVPSNIVIWGSHVHAENSASTPLSVRTISVVSGESSIAVVGSTLHAVLESVTAFDIDVFALYTGRAGKIDIIGSDLIYESPDALPDGNIGGIRIASGDQDGVINLSGVAIIDGKGSGGSTRGDIVGDFFGGPNLKKRQPTVRVAGTEIDSMVTEGSAPFNADVASLAPTTHLQTGTTTLETASSIVVEFSVAMPTASYNVTLSGNANETLWITDKTTSGFTVNSSNPSSTATVDWIVAR